jgi:hypothetical protein
MARALRALLSWVLYLLSLPTVLPELAEQPEVYIAAVAAVVVLQL